MPEQATEILATFIEAFLTDRESGSPGPVEHYAGSRPDAADLIAAYHALLSAADRGLGVNTVVGDARGPVATFEEEWRAAREVGEGVNLEDHLRRNPEAACDIAGRWLHLVKEGELTVLGMRTEGGATVVGTRRDADGTVVDHGLRSGPGTQVDEDRRLGHYQLLEQIGAGGQGQVYLALDTDLHRKVALKLLTTRFADSETSRKRFLREAETASKLQHPGICSVYGMGEIDGFPYIAMQYIEGRPLNDCILSEDSRAIGQAFIDFDRDVAPVRGESHGTTAEQSLAGRGSIARVLAFIEDAARALHAAHEKGLIHRDIKPGNVMVAKDDGRAVLLDFGLARDEESDDAGLTRTGDFMGTPNYMSPEQLLAKPDIDRRADVFSLGITLYECLTLKRPFEEATLDAIFMRILEGEYDDPRKLRPQISKDLAVVVATAIERDRNRRYQTALDLAEDLRRVRVHEPISARPIGPFLRAGRWAQRNPVIATLSLAIFVGLIGFLVNSSIQNHRLEIEKQRAEAEKERAQRLSDPYLMDAMADSAEALWSAYPDREVELADWLREVEPLAARIESHRSFVDSLAADTVASWTAEERRMHALFAARFPKLIEFIAPETGTVASVQRRLAVARRLAETADPGNMSRWEAVRHSLASDARFDGFVPRAATGLAPLGADPDSGLQEFLHLPSHTGPLPQRDDEGRLDVDGDTGIVFVLVPGGAVAMGSVKKASVHEVRLDPFFISKYELSYGQWLRLGGPASYLESEMNPVLSKAHPIERYSWEQGYDLARDHGLDVPTEAQWEYAARAGTTTLFWTGDDPADLVGKVHGGSENVGEGALSIETLAANPFGLHHVLGNVWEWCRDLWGPYDAPVRDGDGLRLHQRGSDRCIRGGAYSSSRHQLLTTSFRNYLPPRGFYPDATGMRLSRLALSE